MVQFYSPEIKENPFLPEAESAHCCRVLRMKEGDEIYVTDGKGSRYVCEIVRAHPTLTEIKIKEEKKIKLTRLYHLTLAVAPTKNSERMEWMLEKAVEIGVDKVVLLRCKRSERKIQRIDRLNKVMISAMKQSLDVKLPILTEIINFPEFVLSIKNDKQKFFGYCSETFPRKEFVREYKPGGEVVVIIGPEGDFTEEEVELAVKNGIVPVSFGEKRLRTETAGVFAVSAVNVINQLSID